MFCQQLPAGAGVRPPDVEAPEQNHNKQNTTGDRSEQTLAVQEEVRIRCCAHQRAGDGAGASSSVGGNDHSVAAAPRPKSLNQRGGACLGIRGQLPTRVPGGLFATWAAALS
jgi:hypothetical protein